MCPTTEQKIRDEWRTLRAENPELQTASLRISKQMSTRSLGNCRFRSQLVEGERKMVPVRVSISHALCQPTLAERALETLRHEAAHAIAGYEAAHGPEWKRVARRLGLSNPKPCGGDTPRTPEEEEAFVRATNPKWRIDCDGCDMIEYKKRLTDQRRRRIRGAQHSGCGGTIRVHQLRS